MRNMPTRIRQTVSIRLLASRGEGGTREMDGDTGAPHHRGFQITLDCVYHLALSVGLFKTFLSRLWRSMHGGAILCKDTPDWE